VAQVSLTRQARIPLTISSAPARPKSPLSITPSIEGGTKGGLSGNDVDGVANILTQAVALTKAQRKELLARLALEATVTKPEQSRDVDMWTQALYSALQTAFGAGDGGLAGPAVIKRLVAAPSAWRPVADFMTVSHFDELTVTERQSLYKTLAALVVEQARAISLRNSIPLSVKLAVSCSGNLQALFDRSFPGYLASGLGLVVARRIVAGTQPH